MWLQIQRNALQLPPCFVCMSNRQSNRLKKLLYPVVNQTFLLLNKHKEMCNYSSSWFILADRSIRQRQSLQSIFSLRLSTRLTSHHVFTAPISLFFGQLDNVVLKTSFLRQFDLDVLLQQPLATAPVNQTKPNSCLETLNLLHLQSSLLVKSTMPLQLLVKNNSRQLLLSCSRSSVDQRGSQILYLKNSLLAIP